MKPKSVHNEKEKKFSGERKSDTRFNNDFK